MFSSQAPRTPSTFGVYVGVVTMASACHQRLLVCTQRVPKSKRRKPVAPISKNSAHTHLPPGHVECARSMSEQIVEEHIDTNYHPCSKPCHLSICFHVDISSLPHKDMQRERSVSNLRHERGNGTVLYELISTRSTNDFQVLMIFNNHRHLHTVALTALTFSVTKSAVVCPNNHQKFVTCSRLPRSLAHYGETSPRPHEPKGFVNCWVFGGCPQFNTLCWSCKRSTAPR